MTQEYPTGTIFACPIDACGLNLYRIVARAQVSIPCVLRATSDVSW